MNLSGRLKAIADAVPKCRAAADIGTDHGYIPVYLVRNKIVDAAIASDISSGSLDKAKKLISQAGLGDVIDTRLGSGLEVLKPGEVDTIIIAGMGGLLIRDILDACPDTAGGAALILQPMVAQENLRKWLLENGYMILDEDLVREDHRYYEIITAAAGHQTVENEIYYEIGRRLIEKQHPLLEEFVLHKIKSLEAIMEALKKAGSKSASEREDELGRKLRQLKEVYRWDVRSKRL